MSHTAVDDDEMDLVFCDAKRLEQIVEGGSIVEIDLCGNTGMSARVSRQGGEQTHLNLHVSAPRGSGSKYHL